jgi:TraY domain-containing protein
MNCGMKKRVGRPIKEPDPGERAPLSLRVRPMIKKKLEEAAELEGRSLSQEAEFRLEHTFDRQSLLREVMTLAFGKEWGSFLLYHGILLKQFNAETSERLRNIIENAIYSHDEEKNYRELPPQSGGRKVRRYVAEVAGILRASGFDATLGAGAYEPPSKKRKGRRS